MDRFEQNPPMNRAEAFANIRRMCAQHRDVLDTTAKMSPERAVPALIEDVRLLGKIVEALALTVEKLG